MFLNKYYMSLALLDKRNCSGPTLAIYREELQSARGGCTLNVTLATVVAALPPLPPRLTQWACAWLQP
eukprot:7467324-Pyramimonas_sp.AAC.1